MVFEHFALNVKEIDKVVHWYCKHLNLKVVSKQKEAPFMTFLADSKGRVFLELYSREDAKSKDFRDEHPLTFHLAFESGDAEKDKIRLVANDATFVEEIYKDDGSHLVMLRDPWGMPLQFCQRTTKF